MFIFAGRKVKTHEMGKEKVAWVCWFATKKNRMDHVVEKAWNKSVLQYNRFFMEALKSLSAVSAI